MISIKNLRAFVTVVDEMSFTRAAERLYQTQPGLSMQVRNLEQYVNAELVERKDKGIRLTDAGEIFYPEAIRILAMLDSVKEAVNELKGLKRGYLSIGASTLPGEYIIPDITADFLAAYPLVNVNLMIGDTKQVVAALKSGEIQIAFLGAVPHDSMLDTQKFRDDELLLAGPYNWPDNYSWARFPLEKLIFREKGSGTRTAVEKHLADKEIKLPSGKNIREVGSTHAIIKLISAGAGISFVSRWAVEEPLRLGKIKILSCPVGSIKRMLYAARLKDSYLSFSAKAFWQYALTGIMENRIGTEVF
jgi:DNA-binding transcriptional LysR family regulator